MDIVIKDVATGSILNINDTALLKKTDIFNDVEQTQIKIGKNAGVTQAPNSIILNATGDVLNNNAMNDNGTCVIAPIRAQPVASHFLTYDDTTKEIVKSTIEQVQGAVGGGGGSINMMTYNVFPKIQLSSTILAFGDSYNQPDFTGTAGAPNREWGAGMIENLANLTGKTLINYALGGSEIDYITGNGTLMSDLVRNPVFSNYSSIIAYGFNDMRGNQGLYTNIYAWTQCLLASVLSVSLPMNKILVAGDPTWTESGTWAVSANEFANFRRNTSVLDAYIEKNIGTVRYIAVQFLTFPSVPVFWEVRVNGILQNTFINNVVGSQDSGSYRASAFVIDLCENVENCVVRITNKSTNTTVSKWIDYVCGWTDADVVNARQVLLTSIPRYNIDTTDVALMLARDARHIQYNNSIEHVAKMCRHWRLPVSFYRLNEVQGIFTTDSFHTTALQGKAWAKELIDHALIL